jgi:hypothetical protein
MRLKDYVALVAGYEIRTEMFGEYEERESSEDFSLNGK